MPSPELIKPFLPNGHRSIMASRQEAKDSLDLFCTPPWATRALMRKALPRLGVTHLDTVWDPAAGTGHIFRVLTEYANLACGSDIKDYGCGLTAYRDFHDPYFDSWHPDWIITNPPYRDKSIPFVLRSLALAKVGVAMFVRSQWINEGLERYRKVFKPNPPTLIAFFTERVNLCKGRWDPDGSTATAYCWVVWLKGARRRPPYWIPPGCRKKYTHPDDRERFAK